MYPLPPTPNPLGHPWTLRCLTAPGSIVHLPPYPPTPKAMLLPYPTPHMNEALTSFVSFVQVPPTPRRRHALPGLSPGSPYPVSQANNHLACYVPFPNVTPF